MPLPGSLATVWQSCSDSSEAAGEDMKGHRYSRESGYTLLELMFVLAVVVALGALAYNGLSGASDVAAARAKAVAGIYEISSFMGRSAYDRNGAIINGRFELPRGQTGILTPACALDSGDGQFRAGAPGVQGFRNAVERYCQPCQTPLGTALGVGALPAIQCEDVNNRLRCPTQRTMLASLGSQYASGIAPTRSGPKQGIWLPTELHMDLPAGPVRRDARRSEMNDLDNMVRGRLARAGYASVPVIMNGREEYRGEGLPPLSITRANRGIFICL